MQQSNRRKKILSKLTALLACGLLGFSSFAQGNDLNQIQKQIKQQESKIAEQKRAQAKLQASLKEIRKQMAETEKQIKQLEKQERVQKAKLAQQIDAIYRSGVNPSTLERMLSEDAKKAERMKVYYQHLNQVRIDMINNLKATQENLAKQREAISGQQKNHRDQLSTQKKQQQELQKAQQERQSTLNELNKNLTKDQNKLETLKANENALRQEIQRAEQAARQQEQRERERTSKPYQPTDQERKLINSTSGLGTAARQYSRPVSGPTLYSFGSIQAGEVRWKGMVIGAPTGTAVKAIASGRVILAGHLNGYGYMVIVKHGDSDLSLYGFNQAVFVKQGQLVSAGQTIAQVGNTGELSKPALYFGISRKGVPVNPAGWIK